MSTRALGGGLLLLLCVSGCGGSGGTTDGGAGGGGPASGGGPATGGSGGFLVPAGFVSVEQSQSPLGGDSTTSAAAGFYTVLPSASVDGCTSSTVDGCLLQECARDGGFPSLDAGVPRPAGAVTIATPQATLTLMRSAGGIYSANASGTGTWSGGEVLRATGTGDAAGAPAFSLEVSAPTRLVQSAPPAGATISRTAPLAVSWQASATGSTDVKLTTGDLLFGRATIATCTVPASAGTFTLSAAVTARLAPGGGALQLINRASVRQSVGGWTLDFSGTSSTTSSISVP